MLKDPETNKQFVKEVVGIMVVFIINVMFIVLIVFSRYSVLAETEMTYPEIFR